LKVNINGKITEIKNNTSLKQFINEKGLDRNKIVIEYNKEILDNIENIIINDGDNIEILKIVGGG